MGKGIKFKDKDNQDIYPCPFFPVGSIYMSVNNLNPSQFFGGSWEQIKDRFLLSAGNTYKAGNTGGEANHKLTINEMPSHQHTTMNIAPGLYKNWGNKNQDGWVTESVRANGGNWDVGATGGNQSHNNMPPYLVVYVWKRVR